MTLDDLIRRFRTLADDKTQPYRTEDEDVADWLNDAQAQACIRGRMLVADGDTALCQIALTPGQSSYLLHRALYEIITLRIAPTVGVSRMVTLKTREWLNAELPDWRDDPRQVCFAVQNDTSLRLVGAIEPGEVLHLEAYRLPLKKLQNETDKPEIHESHHEHLIQWALHKAFSVPDSEIFDPNRSALAERAFTGYFGPLPDSDLRRSTRHDQQQTNALW